MSEKISVAGPSDDAVMKFVEVLISRILLGGVLTSMAIVFAGLVLMFVHHPDSLRSAAELKQLTAGAAFPHTAIDVLRGVAALRGRAIVALGLVVLLATPIMRVAISLVGFAVERDKAYAAISAFVLALLAASFFLGRIGG